MDAVISFAKAACFSDANINLYSFSHGHEVDSGHPVLRSRTKNNLKVKLHVQFLFASIDT